MTANEYQRLAMTTRNADMTDRDTLINGVMGLCGESGEVIDLVKKHLAQGFPLDREHIVKELGDVMWYIAEIATVMGVTMEEIMEANIEKLRRRYPDGFSYEKALHRSEDDQ